MASNLFKSPDPHKLFHILPPLASPPTVARMAPIKTMDVTLVAYLDKVTTLLREVNQNSRLFTWDSLGADALDESETEFSIAKMSEPVNWKAEGF